MEKSQNKISLPPSLEGEVGMIFTKVIAMTTCLEGWALMALIIAFRFLQD
jgi:hypothetical protein